MRDWNSLIETIRNFLRVRCIFPETIKPILREKFQQHNAHTLEVLEAILRTDVDDHDKINRLQLFLSARWRLIMHTSVDYTFHPNFPANLACFHVATVIAGEEKAVCQLLMPTIKKVIGSGIDESDLKEASESPVGTFPLHGFLIGAHGDLISILDVYDYATKDPDYLFGDKFNLTELDRHHLKICASDASIFLFDAIKEKYLKKHSQSASVGSLLHELSSALYKASKKENGNEYQADQLEALPAIHNFYAHWQLLSQTNRNRIKFLRVKGATFPLESFLLCLFVRAKLDVTPEEFQRVVEERITPCAHDISQQLSTLLNENIDFLCTLNLSSDDTEAVYSEKTIDFDERMEDLLKALVNRMPMPGFDDQRFFYQQSFEHLTYYHLSNELYIIHLNAITARIKNMADFSAALRFVPELFWAYFAETLKTTDNFHFSETRDEIPNIQYLLEQLPASQWSLFFQAFHAVIPHWIDSTRLSRIAVSLKGETLNIFIAAIRSFLPNLLLNGAHIAQLFLQQPESEFAVLFRLFETPIERVLVHPRELADFCSVLYQEGIILVPLLKLLMPILKKQLCEHPDHFFTTIKLFSNPEYSLTFLKSFIVACPEFSMNKDGLIQLLRYYDARYYELFFAAIAPILPRLISRACDLSAWLAALDPGEECDLFVFHLIPHIQVIDESALTVYAILKQFPSCEHLLLALFEPCLKTILVDLSDNLTSYARLGLHHLPSDDIVRLFDFFFEKALPILLSNGYLKENLTVWTIYELSETEMINDAGFCVYRQLLGASPIDRLKIIVAFINSQIPILFHRTSALYRDLIEYFGEKFFQRLLKLHEQRNVVPLQSAWINQGFFTGGQHRSPHAVFATRAVNAAPEPIGILTPPRPV